MDGEEEEKVHVEEENDVGGYEEGEDSSLVEHHIVAMGNNILRKSETIIGGRWGVFSTFWNEYLLVWSKNAGW